MKDLLHICGMLKLFKFIKPDIILSYTIKPVIYGSIAARLASTPSTNALITGLGYTFMNSSLRQRSLNFFIRGLYRFALHRTKTVFFQNPDDLELFKKLSLLSTYSEPALVNGSGVDLTHFKPSPYPERLVFLLIARLIKEKGIYEYVCAARKVKRKNPDAVFHLVGWIDDGPSAIPKAKLDAWCKEGVIRYFGRLEDVRPAIKACSVYVLPSYREGTPRTVLEAMAMGRAIITTDTPGCRQTIESGRNGLLVPVMDVDALGKAMQYFIEHPRMITTMGQQSRLIAQEKFDVHKVNAMMLKKLGLS